MRSKLPDQNGKTANTPLPAASSVEPTPFVERVLPNGLRVILHRDGRVPVVTINVLYRVGSKDEEPGKTGFAHLFEHLMFDGSKNVPKGDYDRFCTMVGGENNAFTTSDITDYHITLPADHLELGLWMESDRMAGFAVGPDSLETQKSVVLEEKKQTQDDVPYGDVAEVMKSLAYHSSHPYSWDTIGSAEDIRNATMEDVRAFYERYYRPSRSIVTVAGDIDLEQAAGQVEAYFGDIAAGPADEKSAFDPAALSTLCRTGGRRRIERDIYPFNAVFMGWHAPPAGAFDLRALDLLCDVLAEGESSRLYSALEYEMEIASEVDVMIDDGELGSMLYVFAIGQNAAIGTGELEEEIRHVISRVAREGVSGRELRKVINRRTTRIAHALQSVSNRADRFAWFAALFNEPMLAYREGDLYESITADDLQRVAAQYLDAIEPNVIEYLLPN